MIGGEKYGEIVVLRGAGSQNFMALPSMTSSSMPSHQQLFSLLPRKQTRPIHYPGPTQRKKRTKLVTPSVGKTNQ